MTAWLDYVDARRRLVHEWHEQGVDVDAICFRIEQTPEQITAIISQCPDPLPGTARWQVRELRRRVLALEQELHAMQVVTIPPPTESEMRALKPHPDPECCGCQYWVDTRQPAVLHNPRCEHAGKRG